MVAVSEKSLVVLNFLRSIDGERQVTSKDIAAELGMPSRSVEGIITSGLIRNKNLVERVQAEITNEDGTHTPIKLIVLTDAGRAYDHEAAVAADEAAAEAEKAAKEAAKAAKAQAE